MSIDDLAFPFPFAASQALPARLADPPTIIVRTHHKGGRGPKTARLARHLGLVMKQSKVESCFTLVLHIKVEVGGKFEVT